MSRAARILDAPQAASLEQVLQWTADAAARLEWSTLTGRPWLLIDARSGDVDERGRERVAAWLRQLPCPTLVIAGRRNDVITRSADLRLDAPAEAAPLIAGIEHSPIAAAVFVQLLRISEALPCADALTLESLAYSTLQGGPEFRRWLAANPPKPVLVSDSGPPLLLEREGEVLRLVLNRASRRNAISMEMRDALVEALQLAQNDPSIGRIEISGRGKCFSIGGDLDEFGTAPDPATAHLVRCLSVPARALLPCAPRTHVHLHGACIGAGIELPAFAHQVSAAPDTFFQLPELRFGLIPGAGGCVSIPRRIGRQRTAWMVISSRRVNARQALDWGLVDAIA